MSWRKSDPFILPPEEKKNREKTRWTRENRNGYSRDGGH